MVFFYRFLYIRIPSVLIFMNLDFLDTRLKLTMDNYLLKFESFKFISKMINNYNNLENVIDLHYKDLKDTLFFDNYKYIYNYLSVVNLKRELDDKELMFISNLIYLQKGSIESLKTLFDIVECDYDNKNIYIDNDYTLHIIISYENIKEIYLSEKYLYLLCKDLLFFKKYDVTVTSMSVNYKLTGEVDKRYSIYTVIDLDTNGNIIEESENIEDIIIISDVPQNIINSMSNHYEWSDTIKIPTNIDDQLKYLDDIIVNDYVNENSPNEQGLYNAHVYEVTIDKVNRIIRKEKKTITRSLNTSNSVTIDTYDW